MTLTQILALCRLEISEIITTDVISDVNLTTLVNLACREFVKVTDALPKSDNFDLVLNLTEYPLSTYVTEIGRAHV